MLNDLQQSLQSPSTFHQIASGICAGFAETTLNYPIGVIKCSKQLHRSIHWNFSFLYRGYPIDLLSDLPVIPLQIIGATQVHRQVAHVEGSIPNMIAKGCGGGLSCLFNTPVEIIMLEQMASGKSCLATIQKIHRTASIRGFFRGMPYVYGKDAIFTASYMEGAKHFNPLIVGLIAALITQPLDTIKTHLQADFLRRHKARAVVRSIFMREGLLGFYRGGTLRCFRVTSSIFIIHNTLKLYSKIMGIDF